MPFVSWLTVAPVKGLALVEVDEVELRPEGVAENRRFYIVDEDGERFGLMRYGKLALVKAVYEPGTERLALTFPDGTLVDGTVEVDGAVTTDFYGRPVQGHVVRGPWAESLGSYAGRPLRLLKADRAGAGVDRGNGGVSMLSDASLVELRRQAGRDEPVDARRFRMLIGIGGTEPHEEDSWIGRRVRVGEAVVELSGQVGRCAITTQNPDTGVRDFDTLREIKGYRGQNPATREIDFGVFGEVVEPARVRVGDPIEPA
jgi:uncharacterized protein YcbX